MITNWQKLINRIEQEIESQLRNNNSDKGQCVVKVVVCMLAGVNGPDLWIVSSTKIEPGTKARALLDLIP